MPFRTPLLWAPFLLLSLALLSITSLRADDTQDLQKKLEQRLLKHVLIIRNFYVGDNLVFDSQGNLLRGDNGIGYDGCRCIAELKVRSLEIKNGELLLYGPRMVGGSEPSTVEYSRFSREHNEVQIDIALDPNRLNEGVITSILNKVFLTDKDNLREVAPYAWKAAEPAGAAEEAGKTGETSAETKEPSKLGHGVTPPKVISSPDPGYSDEARKAKFQGDVLLWIVIDAKGNVTQIKIARCLGFGLDEEAVRAVSQWRFEPARKDGKPLAVQVNVDVHFHLQ